MNHIIRLLAILLVSYICTPLPGQPVGSIPHSFDVSPTGAATFSIPFELLPGVGGMQPSVGITYNSQSGNGVAGWGCHLSGIPEITRVPQSIHFDGKAKGMNFDKWDGFMLNGQRLNKVSLSPELDPNTRVTRQDKGDKFWFKVETADGLTYHYGSNTGVCLYDTWYLDYVEDVYGNYMNYTYEVFNSYMYLKTITYGKNKQDETLNLTVNFEYENRTDHVPFRVNGAFGAMERRLSKVTVKSGSDIFREYTLAYDETDIFSRLTSITLKNGSGESLNPTTIQWNNLPESTNSPVLDTNIAVPLPAYSPQLTYEEQEFTAFDINGDGLCDLMGIFSYDSPKGDKYKEKTLFTYLASIDNGRLSFTHKDMYQLPTSFMSRNVKDQLSGQIFGDYEGKGVNSICLMYYTEEERKRYANYYITGCEETISHEINIGYEMTQVNPIAPLIAMADIDNDGKTEIISLEKFEIADGEYATDFHYLRIKSSGKDWATYHLPLGRALRPSKMFMADFNGNGMVDLMVITHSGYIIFWNTPGNSQLPFTSGERHITREKDREEDITYLKDCNMIRMGDFNGDGLPDLLLNDTENPSWHFAINQGNGNFDIKEARILPDMYNQRLDESEHDIYGDIDDDKFSCLVFDFNFDGKSDVVITKGTFVQNPWFKFYSATTKWLYSTGSELKDYKSVTYINEHDAYSKYIVAGDFTGDGRVEIINYGRDLQGPSTDRMWRRYKNNVTAVSGMVSSVKDGFGNITKISYSGLAEKGTCTKGTGAGYPLADVAMPVAMVASVTVDHGSDSTKMKYNYFGPKVHLKGRGFLGMDSVVVANMTTGVTTKKGVKRYHVIRYLPEEIFTETTIDQKAARSVEEYTYDTIDTIAYAMTYVTAKTNTETDFDQNKTTTRYEYDNGVLLKETTLFDDVDNDPKMYREVRYSDFTDARWLFPNKPQRITITQKHADDQEIFVQETSFYYDREKGHVYQKVENKGTGKELTTTYSGIDIYGNVKQWSVSGQGVPEIQYKRDYKNGRFLEREYTFPESGKTVYEYDDWGNMQKEIDETNPDNILTISHKYNGWGQRDLTTFPDKRKIAYSKGWNNDPQKRYYTLTEPTDAPWEKTWYDQTGRKVETETVGVKGTRKKSTYEYNDKGELKYTETSAGGLTTWEKFGYDGFGRIKTKESNSGPDIEYEYGNRKVMTTARTSEGNRETTKTFDAWGGLKSVTDPAGTVTYTYTSTGSPGTIEAPGNAVFSMTYDEVGNQKTLTDPNSGTLTYTYDALGRMLTQKDERGITKTNEYDELGRIIRTRDNEEWYSYKYGTTGFGKMRLTGIMSNNSSTEVDYSYNKYGDMITENRRIRHEIDGAYDEESFPATYEYNQAGQLETTTYPGQVAVTNEYDDYGNLTGLKVGAQPVWTLNSTGLTTTSSLAGGTMTTKSVFNTKGLLTNLKTEKGNESIRNFEYTFNATTGNLTSRKGMIAPEENFFYDPVNRLKSIKHGNTETMAMEYFPNGNIKSKTGLGKYYYNTEYAGPHALVGVENTSGIINHRGQKAGYTSFGKVAWVIDTIGTDAYRLDITYGPDQQRWKSELKRNGNVVKTIIFAGNYERISENGVTREFYYIGGNAIVVKKDGISTLYYVHPDHLGSFAVITDVMGNIVQKCSYDAWGNRKFEVKDPALVFDRGYTGHEHLDEFGLINMNGRMYDPLVGRFLSPDPFVQAPEYSQSFNRYSYCLNNPLIYTDPEGEFAWFAAAIILVYNYLQSAHDHTPPGKDDGNPKNWAWNPGKWNKSNFDDPNSFNFMITIGSNPNGSGTYAQLSGDIGKLSFSTGVSSGDNYTSYGGGFSIDGYGASYYRTYFGSAPGPDGKSNRQVVGELGFKIRGYSARIANDFLGDGHDRWRSNAVEIGIGDFVVGTFLYNNDPAGEGQDVKGKGQNHPEAVDRRGNFNRTFKDFPYSAWDSGKTYTSPGYVGLRNGSKLLRLGYSHEKFQDRTQNWVHRNGFLFLPMGHQNFYIDYTEFQRGPYHYSGYHNPYSIY